MRVICVLFFLSFFLSGGGGVVSDLPISEHIYFKTQTKEECEFPCLLLKLAVCAFKCLCFPDGGGLYYLCHNFCNLFLTNKSIDKDA
jgi:hypothetical protein